MIQVYENDLIDRFPKDLTPIELHFLQETDAHDLKGHTALCNNCYFELGCKSFC